MKQFLFFFSGLMIAGTVFSQKADCSDFFFSEYIEGSSQNKALEIYNPTNSSKSLSGYTIKRYANGDASAGTSLNLTGVVPAYDVFIVTNGQIIENEYGVIDSVLYFMADQWGTGDHSTCPMYFNGNDALTLEKTGGIIVDIFARIGSPAPVAGGWTDQPGGGDYITENIWEAWTANHGLIRKNTILKGVTSNPTPFIVNLQWDSIPEDVWDSLGFHTCDCKLYGIETYENPQNVYFFPNPVINDELTVKGTDYIFSVEMINLLGERVIYIKNEEEDGEVYMQFTNLNPGIYFIKTKFLNNTFVTRKIVVN